MMKVFKPGLQQLLSNSLQWGLWAQGSRFSSSTFLVDRPILENTILASSAGPVQPLSS